MPSKRDELHSYQFMMRRLASAFTYGSADPAQPRFERSGSALFAGAMVAVLLLAGFGVYGMLSPGGNAGWRDENALILERETGALYIYRNGLLHPVLNYSSARLILKRAGATATPVSANSLRGTARGAALGIPGAPETVPPPGSLLNGPWHLCSQPRRDDSGRSAIMSVLVVSGQAPGGKPLDKQAVVVKDPAGGQTYLVTDDRRFRLPQPDTVLGAFAMREQPRIPVSQAWLSALPAGSDIGPISIAGAGNAPSAGPAGARIGQVVKTQSQSGESQAYVVLDDGLAQITPLQVDLIINDPSITNAAYAGQTVQVIQRPDVASAKRSEKKMPTLDAPAITPKPAPVSQQTFCAAFTPGARGVRISIDSPPVDAKLLPPRKGVVEGRLITDAVVIQPGYGVLIETLTGTGTARGALFLVTDQGLRHALATREVLSYLDYEERHLIRVPAGLAQLVPDGAALDPASAEKPVTPT